MWYSGKKTVLGLILIFRIGFQDDIITQSRFLRLIIKTLCSGFLISIIDRVISILEMFKCKLKTLRFIIFLHLIQRKLK